MVMAHMIQFYCSLHSLIDYGHGGQLAMVHIIQKVASPVQVLLYPHACFLCTAMCLCCMCTLHHLMLAICIYACMHCNCPARKSNAHPHTYVINFVAIECSNLCILLLVFSTVCTVLPTSVYILGMPLF